MNGVKKIIAWLDTIREKPYQRRETLSEKRNHIREILLIG
jgi:hypothetical protein